MRKVVLLLVALAVVYLVSIQFKSTPAPVATAPVPARPAQSVPDIPYLSVYDQLDLGRSGLQKNTFIYALRGWQKMGASNPLLSIADLSQPSTRKRLYVIDLHKGKLLFQTYVSHGENSGDLIPSKFSNVHSSFQTSLGFYQTLNTYMGKHGLSLQLKGLEKGFNDNVYNRNIVLHGAAYVCEEHIRKTGRLGCSQGCPAVPYADSKNIIKAVKGGSCLFIYAPDANYLQHSTYVGEPTPVPAPVS